VQRLSATDHRDIRHSHNDSSAASVAARPPLETVPRPGADLARPHPLLSTVVGVLAHDEEATIETCLQAILAEHDLSNWVQSVVVVASGCTDRTEEIVRKVAADDARVRVVVEPERTGKAAAINLLLRESKEPIVVVLGGDVVFTPGSLLKLVAPFVDPTVGMTGARPVPTNRRTGLMGNAVHILWGLHHELSLERPKLGEAVAFRRLIEPIDRDTLVDEAVMEHVISSLGMQLRYVPGAIVRNHGAETIREYIAQRARVYTGHLNLAAKTRYRVSSMHFAPSARAAWRLWRQGERLRFLLLTIALEGIARAQARATGLGGHRRTNGIWHPIQSSKRVLVDGHVLRSHHERLVRMWLRPKDAAPSHRGRIGRVAASRVRALVRVEDEISHDKARLLITFRSDENGTLALCARLRTQLPDFEQILPNGSSQ
jgi:biofilm PGA synthesis N-glycosyltransferase PgaC